MERQPDVGQQGAEHTMNIEEITSDVRAKLDEVEQELDAMRIEKVAINKNIKRLTADRLKLQRIVRSTQPRKPRRTKAVDNGD